MNEIKPIPTVGTDEEYIKDKKPTKFNPRNTILKRGGRPLNFKTDKELITAIEDYFTQTDKPTLSGLAYYIGLSRQSLYDYKASDKYSYIIKKATALVESMYEERLLYSDKPTGVIFALKNMNWTDRQEIQQKTEITVPIMGGTSLKAKTIEDTTTS